MATQIFGTTEFTWTDSGAKTHTLAVPIQQVQPAYSIRQWTRTSISYVNRETWVAGFAYEISGLIRYDDTPQSLIDLLLAGGRGLVVTYDDDTNQTACYMVAPVDRVVVAGFDAFQQSEDWHRMAIRLRRTNNAAFPSSVFTT